MSEEQGIQLSDTSNVTMSPETIKAIAETFLGVEAKNSILPKLENKANTIKLPVAVIDKIIDADSTINKDTIIKYLLCINTQIVQEYKDTVLFSNYAGLLTYPNIHKKAYIISKPRMIDGDIIFDIDSEVRPDARLDLICLDVEDDNVISITNNSPYVGSIIKLVIV